VCSVYRNKWSRTAQLFRRLRVCRRLLKSPRKRPSAQHTSCSRGCRIFQNESLCGDISVDIDYEKQGGPAARVHMYWYCLSWVWSSALDLDLCKACIIVVPPTSQPKTTINSVGLLLTYIDIVTSSAVRTTPLVVG